MALRLRQLDGIRGLQNRWKPGLDLTERFDEGNSTSERSLLFERCWWPLEDAAGLLVRFGESADDACRREDY